MGRVKRKSNKRKHEEKSFDIPNTPRPNRERFEIEEKVYYQDLYNINHDWRIGIVKSLMSQRGNEFIIFMIEDYETHTLYPVNKNVVVKYGKHRPKSRKSNQKEDKKHPNYR